MSWILLLVPVATAIWVILGLVSLRRITARRRASPAPTSSLVPGVSVLKPLCGLDPSLEGNLRSFFEQDHPSFELVFGAERDDDPALEVVARLRSEYPHVSTVVVVCSGLDGINPKVRNLRGMLPHASHDHVLISDSNIVAPPHYVREAATLLAHHPEAALVTHLFAGTGESTLAAALENVQLNGFCAAGAALPTELGDASVIGKSMLLRRAVLDELGGLERVKDVLAEDYVLGKTLQHAGHRVLIAPTVLANVTQTRRVLDFHQRHLRWAMLRARLRPAAYLAEVLTFPLVSAPLVLAATNATSAVLWFVAVIWLRDVGGWLLLRGATRLWIPLLLSPVREALMLLTWVRGLFKRHIAWRGTRVRLGPGTLLFRARA